MTLAIRPLILLPFGILTGCASLRHSLPEIAITHVPAWQSAENLEGRVSGVEPQDFQVAAYLWVESAHWWSKPSSQRPATELESDGSFSVDVTTGGNDGAATRYLVALLPREVSPPVLEGAEQIPPQALAEAVASAEIERVPDQAWRPPEVSEERRIEFAGRMWGVKESDQPVGPGGNVFSAAASDVWVDDEGLHLTIHEHGGRWWCTEVVLQESLGHGTYLFQTVSRVDTLDAHVVAGLFTWDPSRSWRPGGSADSWPWREMDIEYARWGDAANPTNAHFAVQPWHVEGNTRRFTVPGQSHDARLTALWTWEPGRLRFAALRGLRSLDSLASAEEIARWDYEQDPAADHWVPDEGSEQVRINLWLSNVDLGRGDRPQPSDGQAVELIVRDFQFRPLAGLE